MQSSLIARALHPAGDDVRAGSTTTWHWCGGPRTTRCGLAIVDRGALATAIDVRDMVKQLSRAEAR